MNWFEGKVDLGEGVAKEGKVEEQTQERSPAIRVGLFYFEQEGCKDVEREREAADGDEKGRSAKNCGI